MESPNEQKARSLCCSGCNNYQCYTDNGSCINLKNLIMMAEWKDEQHAKEKQQWIEKACEFLKRNAERYTCLDFNDGCAKAIYDEDELVADFKQAMKGE